jgi:hypothetical protein
MEEEAGYWRMDISDSGERKFLAVDRGAFAVHLRLLGKGNESMAWLTTYI